MSKQKSTKQAMKSVIITDYIHGLASFLDEENIAWEQLENQQIKIHYTTPYDLFIIGYKFGKFYESITD